MKVWTDPATRLAAGRKCSVGLPSEPRKLGATVGVQLSVQLQAVAFFSAARPLSPRPATWAEVRDEQCVATSLFPMLHFCGAIRLAWKGAG